MRTHRSRLDGLLRFGKLPEALPERAFLGRFGAIQPAFQDAASIDLGHAAAFYFTYTLR
jgi:hypothetical protein